MPPSVWTQAPIPRVLTHGALFRWAISLSSRLFPFLSQQVAYPQPLHFYVSHFNPLYRGKDLMIRAKLDCSWCITTGQRFLNLPKSSIRSPASRSTEARCFNKSLSQKHCNQKQLTGNNSVLSIFSISTSHWRVWCPVCSSFPRTSWLFPVYL